ncbi:MAG TPA: ATP-binding protein [Pseudolabrys sp.]|nr:ATP-binding protein [Pseudolabrys sp.]
MLSKALIAWSSGKDSAWALHEIRKTGEFEIAGALTTLTSTFSRVSMHGVREALLREQLRAAQLQPVIAQIPFPCPNDVYEKTMTEVLAVARASKVTHIVFGDLFLEDVRKYRERQLAGTGITPLFPLWGRPTARLAQQMIDAGLEARLCAVDLGKLPASFSGRCYDKVLLETLPTGTDHCGENGEFHTFVTDGPMLLKKIAVSSGMTVERDGYAYTDLLPA